MRYHTEPPEVFGTSYGKDYRCDHPVYNHGTLYTIGDKGLVVIQQKYMPGMKQTWWDVIDKEYRDMIYLNKNFKEFFDKHADRPKDGLYPTVTLRQIMWGLRMKPLKKQPWETYFDHKPI